MRLALVSALLVACQTPPPAPTTTSPRRPPATEAAGSTPANSEPELVTTELGPACPKRESTAEVTLPNAEAAIENRRASFSGCARGGRGGSTEVSWIVPPKGAVEMLGAPEPEPDEWCLLEAARKVTFPSRATRTVIVNAAVRLAPDGSVRLDITQAQVGKAVICQIVTRGGTLEGSDRAALALADTMTVCYRQAQRSDPSQTGGMFFELTLRDDGTVSDVRIEAKRRSDLARDCARATAALARFPAPNGPARIEFSLDYVPE